MEPVHDRRSHAGIGERLRPPDERRAAGEQRLGILQVIVVRETDLRDYHVATIAIFTSAQDPTAEVAESAESLLDSQSRRVCEPCDQKDRRSLRVLRLKAATALS